MRLSLLPDLTEAQTGEVRNWVSAVLAHAELTPPRPYFPLGGSAAVYVEGQLRVLERGEYWQNDGASRIYVGYSHRVGGTTMQPLEQLAVVGAVISLANLWSEFHEAYTARAARIVFASYEGVMSGMIQTEAAVTGLAFNADRSLVAARIGDCYHLPEGTQVEIDDTWTLVPDRPSAVRMSEAAN
jgi:hypothetical protein